MSEGTSIFYVSRWLINDGGTGVLQGVAALDGVQISYKALTPADFETASGRIEAIYWADVDDVDVDVRAMKGTASIKYAERAERELVIIVIGGDTGDTHQDIDERAANLLGEVVKAVQANQPTSPGAHLSNIRVTIEDWDARTGVMARSGTQVAATTIAAQVVAKANVEQ